MRVAAQALLEIGDATLKPPVGLDQLGGLHKQGDRHLPVAVKDRLRLGAFHDPRLRRAAGHAFDRFPVARRPIADRRLARSRRVARRPRRCGTMPWRRRGGAASHSQQ